MALFSPAIDAFQRSNRKEICIIAHLNYYSSLYFLQLSWVIRPLKPFWYQLCPFPSLAFYNHKYISMFSVPVDIGNNSVFWSQSGTNFKLPLDPIPINLTNSSNQSIIISNSFSSAMVLSKKIAISNPYICVNKSSPNFYPSIKNFFSLPIVETNPVPIMSFPLFDHL